MTIDDIVATREIEEVLHFTTNSGLTGILATGAVKARQSLPKDQYLEHIYKPNCPDRSRDTDWHGYVNLSVSRINTGLFDISSDRWHADIDGWWCILAFSAEILAHEGVYFTTTNNIYTGIRRAKGPEGLEAMFTPRIVQWPGRIVTRAVDLPACCPTCPQAEVLYPGDLALDHLKRIHVRDVEHADAVAGICGGIPCEPVECVVTPHYFQSCKTGAE